MDSQKTLFLVVGVLVLGLVIGGAFSGQATRKIVGGGGGSGCTDRDGDGYYKNTGCGTLVDCNDDNPSIHPNAVEVCSDGIDQNCDGIDQACTTVSTSTTPPASDCIDSDNGQNIYVKGTTYNSNTTRIDACRSTAPNSTLNEYYCLTGSNGIGSSILGCPSGYSCNDGACRLT